MSKGKEKRDVLIQFLVSKREREALDLAAKLDFRTRSALIRVASLEKAQEILKASKIG